MRMREKELEGMEKRKVEEERERLDKRGGMTTPSLRSEFEEWRCERKRAGKQELCVKSA